MNSFYGGPAGNSFKITKIFKNRVEMDSDLNAKVDSSIDIGSFVIISYGLGNEAIENRKIDQSKYAEDYNGTLWEKIYLESVADTDPNFYIFINQDVKGLGYKLITALVGPMPEVILMPKDEIDPSLDADGLRVLDANQIPTLELDLSNAEQPKFIIGLPRSQVLSLLQSQVINNNEEPKIEYNDDDINNPTLQFFLPRAKNVLLREKTDNNGLAAAGLKRLKANELPILSYDGSDVNNLVLTFGLPQGQVISVGKVDIIGSTDRPQVTMDDNNINNPKLNFQLPRAPIIRLGTKLGDGEGTYQLDEDLYNGDLYVNTNKNYVYQVIEEHETYVTVKYVQSLQIQTPIIHTSNNDSYKLNDIGEYVINNARIVTGYDETGRWKWDVEIPSIPNIKASPSFVGAAEAGSITGKPTALDTYTLEFRIPAGSRFFTGYAEGSNISVAVAKPGDYYLSSESGNVYELQNNEWILVSNIKGPVGDSLKTVANFTFYPNEQSIPQEEKDKIPMGLDISDYIFVDTDTSNSNFTKEEFSEIIEKIEKRLNAAKGAREIKIDELVTITIIRDKDSLSYWFYQNTYHEWQVPIQITAGITTIVQNTYTDASYGDLNSIMYSVGYINGLITDVPAAADKDKKTYSSKKIDEQFSALDQKVEKYKLEWHKFSDLTKTN